MQRWFTSVALAWAVLVFTGCYFGPHVGGGVSVSGGGSVAPNFVLGWGATIAVTERITVAVGAELNTGFFDTSGGTVSTFGGAYVGVDFLARGDSRRSLHGIARVTHLGSINSYAPDGVDEEETLDSSLALGLRLGGQWQWRSEDDHGFFLAPGVHAVRIVSPDIDAVNAFGTSMVLGGSFNVDKLFP